MKNNIVGKNIEGGELVGDTPDKVGIGGEMGIKWDELESHKKNEDLTEF